MTNGIPITNKLTKTSMDIFRYFLWRYPDEINCERIDSGYRYFEIKTNKTIAYWKCEGRREYWINEKT